MVVFCCFVCGNLKKNTYTLQMYKISEFYPLLGPTRKSFKKIAIKLDQK
jgi:hypothetical protein